MTLPDIDISVMLVVLFCLLILEVKKGQGFEIKTLETEHTCQEAFKNRRATQQALAHYFKNKIQNNPKYKVKRHEAGYG